MALRAACRCERDFGGPGTIGRGPSMYEMEGPRLVSRHVPADCSASFAPFDRTGPSSLRCSGRPDRRWLGVALAGWLRGFFTADPGVAPAATAQSLLAGGSEFSPSPRARVAPRPRFGVPPRRVAQDAAPGQKPGTAPAPVAQGSGPGQRPRTFPRAGWLGVSSCPKARGHS